MTLDMERQRLASIGAGLCPRSASLPFCQGFISGFMGDDREANAREYDNGHAAGWAARIEHDAGAVLPGDDGDPHFLPTYEHVEPYRVPGWYRQGRG